MIAPAARSIMRAGIIAAGQGTRLNVDGCRGNKAMVQVCGRPLIDHAVNRFRAVGIRRLTIIINDTSDDCRKWLDDNAGDFDLDVIVRTTPSSYASFQVVASCLAGARSVITTIDSIMPTKDFREFVTAATAAPEDAVILGLSNYVDDEAPLWATLDSADCRIRRLGGDSGSHVTAGLYVMPAQHPAEPHLTFRRLRDYLGWLIAGGEPVYGIVLPHVFDIDRPQDIDAAECARRGIVGSGA